MFNFPNIEDRLPLVKNILKKTTEAEIFRHFLGFDYKIGKFYKSPLRADDKNPSFNIYYKNNVLRYKDFGHSEGNCFDFVAILRSTDFQGALSIIISEMNLSLDAEPVCYRAYKEITLREKIRYTRARLRYWEEYDKVYWQQYNISSASLEYYNVYPGKELWTRLTGESWKRIWINNPSNPIYIYSVEEYEIKDSLVFKDPKIKAYRPYQIEEYDRDSTYKWFNGLSGNYVQGLKQLPEQGDILFITSSLKDVITLYQIGIPAIAPNSENSHIDIELLNFLKTKFNSIYVNYDSDSTGVKSSMIFTEKHNLRYWNVPKEYLAKDVSDLVKKTNQETLIKELKKKNIIWKEMIK